MSTWDTSSIDSLIGKTIIITSGTSGIGLETAKVLIQRRAYVIIGADDTNKGQQVFQALKEQYPEGKFSFGPLDLGSSSSIFSFVRKVLEEHPIIDVLINNAGLSGIPKRMESKDGHELIFSVNYLGHFVVTSQLFPLLLRSQDPRIVNVINLRHRTGKMNFEDLDLHLNYNSEVAYAQSKLALMMFTLELHRRCQASGISLKSIPVHPGAVRTLPLIRRTFIKSLGQSPEKGALPLLFAATSIEARSGIYYGPDGLFELWGNPTEAKIAVHAENMLAAAKLWEESERMSGVRFDVSTSKTIGLH